MRLPFNHWVYFILPESVSILLKYTFMIFEVILCFYGCYLVCSWNQTEGLHCKWIRIFMMVLLFTIIEEEARILWGLSYISVFHFLINFGQNKRMYCILNANDPLQFMNERLHTFFLNASLQSTVFSMYKIHYGFWIRKQIFFSEHQCINTLWLLGPFLERKIASYTSESKVEHACTAYTYVLLYTGAATPLPPLIT